MLGFFLAEGWVQFSFFFLGGGGGEGQFKNFLHIVLCKMHIFGVIHALGSK